MCMCMKLGKYCAIDTLTSLPRYYGIFEHTLTDNYLYKSMAIFVTICTWY